MWPFCFTLCDFDYSNSTGRLFVVELQDSCPLFSHHPCHYFTNMSRINCNMPTVSLSLRLTLWIWRAGVKGPPTTGSQQTGSDARRRANAPTVRPSSPSLLCPMTAPTPPWPSCRMSPVWSTLPLTPAWRTTVSQAARPAWQPGAAPRRVSVSVQMDVGVCVWRWSILKGRILKLPDEKSAAGSVWLNDGADQLLSPPTVKLDLQHETEALIQTQIQSLFSLMVSDRKPITQLALQLCLYTNP